MAIVVDHEKNDEKFVPTIVMDYKTFAQDVDDRKVTAIVMRDTKTSMTAAHICECKGTEDKWFVNKLIEDIESWGYTEIILKTDGETAIVQVAETMKRRRNHSTILQSRV